MAFLEPLFARRRGIGRLIGGALEGDPVAIGIIAVVVVVIILMAVFKSRGDE